MDTSTTETESPKKPLKRHNTLARKIAESSKKAKHSEPSRMCGHCNQKLVLKVYKKHERLYRRSDKSWIPSVGVGQQSTANTG